MIYKSLIQQAHNISYVLCADEKNFTKNGNSFIFKEETSTILVVSSFKKDKYGFDKYYITLERYERDVFTSDDPDYTFEYGHHKPVSADYFSYILRNFKNKK